MSGVWLIIVWSYTMKVGDIIKCDDEYAVILDIAPEEDLDGDWLDCYWFDGTGSIEGIYASDVEAVSESG